MSLPPRAFSPGEVEFTIKKIPLKKSPSFDMITAEIIRHLPKKNYYISYSNIQFNDQTIILPNIMEILHYNSNP